MLPVIVYKKFVKLHVCAIRANAHIQAPLLEQNALIYYFC